MDVSPTTSAKNPATVIARYRCFTGPCPANAEKTFIIAPRELKVFDDVISSLFGAPATAGAIELFGPVVADSRVYTPSKPSPTTGSGSNPRPGPGGSGPSSE